jgi:hypothetical protein
MKVKKKICSGCNKPKPIWKNYKREKYCKYCWQIHNPKSKKPKPPIKHSLKQKSKKREAEDIVYSKLRKVFLNKYPSCEARLKDCTLKSTDVHHTFWGSERDSTYLEVNTWKSVCRNCHNIIHDKLSAEESKSLGLKNSYRDGK